MTDDDSHSDDSRPTGDGSPADGNDRPHGGDPQPGDDRLPSDDQQLGDDRPQVDAIDDTPTVTCSRCNHSWDLAYELDVRHAGNDALEQFALDHYRHTGHFPDEVTPWIVDCRHCPDEDQFLSERPARRWAQTHARHTGHKVEIEREPEGSVTVDPDAYR